MRHSNRERFAGLSAPSNRLIPSCRRTNTWTPHSSHCQYGLPRWVRFTGTFSLQTGHGISSGLRSVGDHPFRYGLLKAIIAFIPLLRYVTPKV